jgi:hypothetical protein
MKNATPSAMKWRRIVSMTQVHCVHKIQVNAQVVFSFSPKLIGTLGNGTCVPLPTSESSTESSESMILPSLAPIPLIIGIVVAILWFEV